MQLRNGTTVDLVLDNAALADITADQGGTFSVGGVDSGESNVGVENGDFGASAGFINDLVLATGRAPLNGTPEPGAVALLLGSGVAVIGLRRRVKQ
jgi:hypothetical protein